MPEGDDARVPRSALPPLILCLVALGAMAGCGESAPWDAVGWRPAAPPRRIVAASILAAEVLLEIAPRERIAGVHYLAADSHFSLVVDDVKGLPLVGAEPEQLLAAAPDLVICDAYTRPETLALLRSASVPVVITGNPATFDDIAANVRRLGRVCHLEADAERLVATMQQRLAALAVKAPELAGWRVTNIAGGLHVHGRGSLFDAVVSAAGARNIAAERGAGLFCKLDVETLLGWSPDAIVVGDALDGGLLPEWLRQVPGIALLSCVEQARLVHVRGALLGSTSHRLVEAAEVLQRTLLAWGRP